MPALNCVLITNCTVCLLFSLEDVASMASKRNFKFSLGLHLSASEMSLCNKVNCFVGAAHTHFQIIQYSVLNRTGKTSLTPQMDLFCLLVCLCISRQADCLWKICSDTRKMAGIPFIPLSSSSHPIRPLSVPSHPEARTGQSLREAF